MQLCRNCNFMYVERAGMRCLMAEGFVMVEKMKNNLSYDNCKDFIQIPGKAIKSINDE